MTASMNDAQRRAVEHTGGPLAVLAGPGTGKTRVIVGRIAHLVKVKGERPDRIVAVTFSVKAASELRSRLSAELGSSAAAQIHAHTFHGLGLRLIRRFADVLNLGHDGKRGGGGGGSFAGDVEPVLMDSAQRRRLIRELVMEHDLLRDDRAGSPIALVRDIDAHFEAFWNHALTPEALAKCAKRWGESIEGGVVRGARGPGLFHQGTVVSPEADRARQRRFADMAALFGHFQRTTRARAWLAFGDLITLPLELLRSKEAGGAAAAIIRDEWRHAVVDEFQDVNEAQIQLLQALMPPARHGGQTGDDGPDLCVVGDDDQSIYAFRGADDLAFQRFSEAYPASALVELATNYRSTPAIVAACNRVIGGATHRFAPKKKCEAAGDGAGEDPIVTIVNMRRENEDGEPIAAMILAARAKAQAEGRVPSAWDSFAVVARTHLDLDRISAALELEGIPIHRPTGGTRHDDPGVADVLAWVDLLVNPDATWAARRILLRPPFGLAPDRVTGWERAYRRHGLAKSVGEGDGKDDSSRGRSSSGEGFVAWLRAQELSSDAPGNPAGAAVAHTLTRFAALHDDLARDAATLTGEQALWRIAVCTGAAHADLLPAADRTARVEALVSLLRLASECQSRLDEPRDLAAFRAYMDDLSDRERAEAMDPEERVDQTEDATESEVAIDDADPVRAEEEESGEGVQLLTAHGSKGLEFDTVFVPRVRGNNGYPRTKGINEPEVLPPSVVDRGSDARAIEARRLDEERRIFYVACSRAKQRLVLVTFIPKTETETTAYVRSLVPNPADPRAGPLATIVSGASVIEAAIAQGARLSARGALPIPTSSGPPPSLTKFRAGVAQRRLEARAAAAAALDAIDRPGTTPEDLASAQAALREAAGHLAIIAAMESGGSAPDWAAAAGSPGAWKETIEQIEAARAPRGGGGGKGSVARTTSPGGMVFRPPPVPLKLSYTQIDAYRRCPRCYYLRYVLGAPDQGSPVMVLGTLVHESLQRFYARLRAREAEGVPALGTGGGGGGGGGGLAELHAIARGRFKAAVARGEALTRATLDQALEQLRLAFERLHDPASQVLDIETSHTIAYPRNGHEHTITAKLDRVDQAPDGSRIIIDYKTGRASGKITEPKPDDLQLGMYALALSNASIVAPGRESPRPPFDHAEYWVLSTGERGRIGLHELNFARIYAEIDGAIDGILAGRFEKGDGKYCSAFCDLLGP